MARSRLGRTGAFAALLAGFALAFTWCVPAGADPGGGGAFKVVGASYGQELNYANCMRRHGVPEFPDPSANGVFSLTNINSNTAQYRAADKACQKMLPRTNPSSPSERARSLREALDFAQCMRAHGEPTFPDPKVTNGGLSFSMSGVDPQSPEFQNAQQACRKLAPFGFGGPGTP